MTFCFHAEAMDEIRLYMYWYGQSLRFYPQDLVDVLPILFDTNYGNNKKFTDSMEAKRMTNGMLIKDKYFEHFFNDLTQKKENEFPTTKYNKSNGYSWPINEDLVIATIKSLENELINKRINDGIKINNVPKEIYDLIRKYFCYY